MYGNEINKIMSNYDCYVGTFSWNELHHLDELIAQKLNKFDHACFIVNTQTSIYSGEHWVAVTI